MFVKVLLLIVITLAADDGDPQDENGPERPQLPVAQPHGRLPAEEEDLRPARLPPVLLPRATPAHPLLHAGPHPLPPPRTLPRLHLLLQEVLNPRLLHPAEIVSGARGAHDLLGPVDAEQPRRENI